MNFSLPDPPDPVLLQPVTLTAVAPLYLSFYALAVLAILPNTFIIKLSILPFIVWQAWSCAVGLDNSIGLAKSLGIQSTDRLRLLNNSFVVSMLLIVMRALEWTFIKKPLRRYELPEGQETPVERPLSVANILVDAFDLLWNQRGIGWSWSPNPFPRESTPPPSITSVCAKILVKITALDASQYILQLICPSVYKPGGGSLFDPTLPFLPRVGKAAFATILGTVYLYAIMDSSYLIATLVGRVILRQPASHWPRPSRRPWMATSVRDFWAVRWHQFYRHIFVVFGARPGGALLGPPGAAMGAFAVSALIHHVGLWGLARKTEFRTVGAFYLLMGVGTIMEDAFQRTTGLRVRGWLGWLWAMLWTTAWGMLNLDAWARGGLFGTTFFPDRLRPGKIFIEYAISLFNK